MSKIEIVLGEDANEKLDREELMSLWDEVCKQPIPGYPDETHKPQRFLRLVKSEPI